MKPYSKSPWQSIKSSYTHAWFLISIALKLVHFQNQLYIVPIYKLHTYLHILNKIPEAMTVLGMHCP